MNPRLILAVILSMVIFLSWSTLEKTFFPKAYQYRQEQLRASTESSRASEQKQTQPSLAGDVVVQDPLEKISAPLPAVDMVYLKNEFIRVALNPIGGSLYSAVSLKFQNTEQDNEFILPRAQEKGYLSFDVPDQWARVLFTVTQATSNEVVMEYRASNGFYVKKRYRLRDNYVIDFDLFLSNQGSQVLALQDGYTLHIPDQVGDPSLITKKDKNFLKLSVLKTANAKVENHKKIQTREILYETPQWVAVQNKYFAFAVKPLSELSTVYLNEGQYPPGASLRSKAVILNPKQDVHDRYLLYIGPKDRVTLSGVGYELEKVVSYGFFNGISLFLLSILKFFYGLTGNYGFAIILLTLLAKLALFPLSQKSFKSMKKMQKLQPHITAVREKNKDNPQKAQMEMMKLYKEHKANPIGGCLPVLAQMPIFLALFWLLQSAFELRGAPFLFWIQDLSVKDPTYVLPIAMGGSMLIQQWLSPSMTDPAQKKIMMFLPLVMVFLFMNFPAGLVLYWFISNVVSIVHQKVVQKV